MNVEPLLQAVPGSSSSTAFGVTAVDVPAGQWHAAVAAARDVLGCAFFDFLTAVDDPDGLRVVCHLAALGPLRPLMIRTRLAGERVASVADLYAGAGWHERETAEMFGVVFLDADGQPLDLAPLLLPPGQEGHPLRKDVYLAARTSRPWPGGKEPGESEHSPSRRRLLPPGVPVPGGEA